MEFDKLKVYTALNADEIKRFFDDYQATLAEVERLDILVRTQHDWDA